jgi:hypothetical protein
MGEDLCTTGGWCAPIKMFDTVGFPRVEPPTMSVRRGGIDFGASLHTEHLALIREAVDMLLKRQHLTVEIACIEALSNGWDVHVYRAGTSKALYSYIGIEFTPSLHSIPTVHEHRASRWDDADVWDEEWW